MRIVYLNYIHGMIGPLLINIALLMIKSSVECRKLIQGHIIWNHAGRNTGYTYPADPIHNWDKLLYTDDGIAKELEFGAYLHTKYEHLLDPNNRYVLKEVCFRSIDMDRSLISAQTVAAGIYNLGNFSKNTRTNFRPFTIPIHTTEKSNDWMYKIYQDPREGCPLYQGVKKQIDMSSDWLKLLKKKYATFFTILGQKTGNWLPYSFENISLLYDNLNSLKFHGHALPSWADNHVMDQLRTVSGYALGLKFCDLEMKHSKTFAKMRNGVFTENILKDIYQATKGNIECSLNGYAVNEEGITALLASIGDYNWIVPQYVSSVMIDLYEDSPGSYSVELWYRNDTDHGSYPLHFYGCGFNCSWEKFENVAKSVATDQNTPKLCGIREEKDCCLYLIPGILLLMSTTLLVFPIFCCLKRLNVKRQDTNYSILPLNEVESLREEKSL